MPLSKYVNVEKCRVEAHSDIATTAETIENEKNAHYWKIMGNPTPPSHENYFICFEVTDIYEENHRTTVICFQN